VSATVPVECGGRGIWARHVSLSLLSYEFLAAAPDTEGMPWLADLLEQLQVVGRVGGDLCLDLNLGLDDEQRKILSGMIEDAMRRLERRGVITAAEAAGMQLAPGDPVIWRGEDRVATTPIVELGGALIALMAGTLPSAPAGTWWSIGWDGGWQTIRMREAPGD
jgi:hypothetical protein